MLRFLIKNGFENNPYPIFLDIQLHCSVIAQFILKDILEKVLTHHLYQIPYNHKELINYPNL